MSHGLLDQRDSTVLEIKQGKGFEINWNNNSPSTVEHVSCRTRVGAVQHRTEGLLD